MRRRRRRRDGHGRRGRWRQRRHRRRRRDAAARPAAAVRRSAPPGITQTITVAKDGSGQFTTVQAAVNSIASGSSARIRIDIKAGTYTEKLTIASRSNLCLVGAGATTTILTYNDCERHGSMSTSGHASARRSA